MFIPGYTLPFHTATLLAGCVVAGSAVAGTNYVGGGISLASNFGVAQRDSFFRGSSSSGVGGGVSHSDFDILVTITGCLGS